MSSEWISIHASHAINRHRAMEENSSYFSLSPPIICDQHMRNDDQLRKVTKKYRSAEGIGIQKHVCRVRLEKKYDTNVAVATLMTYMGYDSKHVAVLSCFSVHINAYMSDCRGVLIESAMRRHVEKRQEWQCISMRSKQICKLKTVPLSNTHSHYHKQLRWNMCLIHNKQRRMDTYEELAIIVQRCSNIQPHRPYSFRIILTNTYTIHNRTIKWTTLFHVPLLLLL